ncbi:MAG: hypothetical protein WCC14_00710 [Acidobacteriaceae bacterium]
MARPISLEVPPRDPREELRRRLEQAPVAHAEALLDSYELLQQLHDHGVFELLRGALGASDTLVETAVKAAKSDESIRAIRNALILGKILGSINPDVLQGVAVAVTETLGCYERPIIEPPGLLSLLSQFRHKELRRSMALINKFLETLGNQIKLRGSCE